MLRKILLILGLLISSQANAQPGTPRVEEYLHFLNIETYGAVSGAADVTANIQAALDDSSGKVVVIPAGTWNSDTLTMGANDTLWVCTGATLNLIASADDELLQATSVSNVRVIVDGTIDGDGSNQSAGISIIRMDTVDNLVIEGSGTLQDAYGYAIQLEACTNFTVDGLTMTASVNQGGIRLQEVCSRGLLRNLQSTLHPNATTGYGIFLDDCDNVAVVDCLASECGDEGLVALDSNDCQFVRVTSKDHTADSNGCHCGNSYNMLFDHCIMTGNDGLGMVLNTNGASNTCHHNTVRGGHYSNNDDGDDMSDNDHGILLVGQNCIFDGVTANDNGAYGIFVTTQDSYAPTNNIFKGCITNDNGNDGLILFNSTDDNLVTGHMADGNGDDGIDARGSVNYIHGCLLGNNADENYIDSTGTNEAADNVTY